MQNHLAIGMLAHVDAGKTTLSEGMLYRGGCLRRLGRVDHQDAFLDTDALERRRGITIFAKQAVLPLDGVTLTLLDTPGHVDFSAEMERTLQVLDYAVLIISGPEGVQGHTATLWQLLERYNIPTFLFVNKMDLPGCDRDTILAELAARLHPGCISFPPSQPQQEDIAMCGDENTLAQVLEQGEVDTQTIAALIWERKLFPCYFGSARHLEGVDELLDGLRRYTRMPQYPDAFGAKVYKITRDAQGGRLTHLKVTGGRLAARDVVTGDYYDAAGTWSEKVNQIRIYSGEKYTLSGEALPGMLCAVTGLAHTYPGQGLGLEPASLPPALEPVLAYRVVLPPDCDALAALPKLRQLQEEDPLLAVSWNEATQEIHLHLMGEVQLEVLRHVLLERFGLAVSFDAGRILYRETISAPVIGMGHFEPLRHYAEVHLLLEPGPRGSGLQLASACSEDVLARNWQRLVLTHLAEREHPGVLTGSPVTDLRITLLAGRAHNKHTEGGDFRQATYRALRQGLMQAECVLLEPWYRFELVVPPDAVGRAMTDLQRMTDDVSMPEGDGERLLLSGTAPVAALQEYAAAVTVYTRGAGRLSCSFMGFAPCRDADKVIAEMGYEAERDTENPADSVFCTHGAGFNVRWDEAAAHMHLQSRLPAVEERGGEPPPPSASRVQAQDSFALDKELQGIYERTYGPAKDRSVPRSPRFLHRAEPSSAWPVPLREGPDYLLVDGYNIIHAWEELHTIARENMDAARQVLLDILANYRGCVDKEVILVFDAYKVPGGTRSVESYHGLHVVYTQEAETADAYIEKTTFRLGKKHRVTVATSDGTIQMIILGHGALRISPQMLRAEIEYANEAVTSILEVNNQPGYAPNIPIPEDLPE